MTISIITATYNSARTLRDTLESVKFQDGDGIEHLIIDGLSSDETLSIIKEYDHVSKVISEKDTGIYDAMNKGIRAAGGDVIGILNSDDFYVDGSVLSKVKKKFEDPDVDAIYGDLQYVDAANIQKVIRHWKAGSCTPQKFLYGWMPPHPTFFVRRSIYDAVGLFNTTLKSAADYELMLRILVKNRYRVAYIPEVLVRMRSGGISNSSLKNRIRANYEDRLAWKLNGLKPYFFTCYLKPLRKLGQFF